MSEAEADTRGSPFWRFSLRFYRMPGVADACGEPPVVEAALARAVDPARFIKRRLQRAWSRRDSSGASGSAFADR